MFRTTLLLLIGVNLVLAQSIILPCDDCSEPRKIDTSLAETRVEGCEGHLVEINIKPHQRPQSCSISLVDSTTTEYDYIFYYEDSISSPRVLYSLSNIVSLRFGLKSPEQPCLLDVTVRCAPNITNENNIDEFGSGLKTVNLTPNLVQSFTFNNADNIHNLSTVSTLPSPLSGFSMLNLEDGYYHMVFGNFQALLRPADGVSKLEVYTFSQQAVGNVSWDLGEEPQTTTTTVAPTTTKAPPREFLSVYILGVNEANFVKEHLDILTNITWGIMLRVCDVEDGTQNQVETNKIISCRQVCQMTDNEDRGCVKVEINVEKIPTTTVCNTTGLSKLEYLRSELIKEADYLEEQFKATQVYLDSCSVLTPFSEWALVAMGLSAGVIALILLVAYLTKSGFKFSKPQDSEMHIQNEKNTNSYWEKIN